MEYFGDELQKDKVQLYMVRGYHLPGLWNQSLQAASDYYSINADAPDPEYW